MCVRRDEAADPSIDDSNERIYGVDIAGEVDGAMALRRLWKTLWITGSWPDGDSNSPAFHQFATKLVQT